MASNILPLAECTEDTAPIIGGKAIGLGRLLRAGVRVPPGFALTTFAYKRVTALLSEQIEKALEQTGTVELDRAASDRIHAIFSTASIPEELGQEIDAAYRALCGAGPDIPVAVRSSATAEDLADASFAGQQETYLWVVGAASVRAHVLRCWASLFTARAITYRSRLAVAVEDLAMGVVVQQMVPADAAGVMMTLEPVRGDRSQVYIEAAHGLGEIVVRGEVEPDRFWVDKGTGALRSQTIGDKAQQYRFDPAAGEVRLMDVDAAIRQVACLSPQEVAGLAELGIGVENAFGCPVDIEWAVGVDPTTGERTIYALQARAETIWSGKAPVELPEDVIDRHDDWDVTHMRTAPDINWTTTNAGEAAPGVLTPFTASVWLYCGEHTQRQGSYRVGLFTKEETVPPAEEGRGLLGIFYGRYAIQVHAWALLGDRIPGTTGEAAVQSLFGRVPPGTKFEPTRRFYPSYFLRASRYFFSLPRSLARVTREWDAWWADCVKRIPTFSEAQAIAMLEEGRSRTLEAQIWTSVTVMAAIQPLFDVLRRVVERAGGDLSSLSAIAGNPEMGMVADLWAISRGQMTVEAFVARHGFHGPSEGELISRVWRDDDAPLRRMAEQYARLDESNNPLNIERERLKQKDALETTLLAASPAWKRPLLRGLFRAAATRLALRGVGKRSYLQGLDTLRMTARRLGEIKLERGEIEEADDIFYLTMEELQKPLPADVRELIAKRKARRLAYQQLSIPQQWAGNPQAELPSAAAAGHDGDEDVVNGVGVSAGVVEGIARVVLNPDFAEVHPNEILVASTTDPSWSSIMFISAGIVVDIGGALSHAAVVAREMKIPCVVNTRNGTARIKTGDRISVDGTTGTVRLLKRADEKKSLRASA